MEEKLDEFVYLVADALVHELNIRGFAKINGEMMISLKYIATPPKAKKKEEADIKVVYEFDFEKLKRKVLSKSKTSKTSDPSNTLDTLDGNVIDFEQYHCTLDNE